MQALWLDRQQLSYKNDIELPVAAAGYALIKVDCAAICGTDLAMLQGYYPFRGIPGHEFVGRVQKGSSGLVGQRVVGEINIACANCGACRRQCANHCESRRVLGIKNCDGAFAQYLTLPEQNLHPVPDTIADEAAVFVEPLAAALRILEQVDIESHHRVVLIGAGRLGQLIAQVIATTGCRLLVVNRTSGKLEHLKKLGIDTTLSEDIAEKNFDYAIECSANPDGFALARKLLRPQGTLILKSTYPGNVDIDMSSLVVDEIHLLGSRCGPFDKALRMLEAGLIQTDYLATKIFALSEGIEAFEFAAQPQNLKTLIKPGL